MPCLLCKRFKDCAFSIRGFTHRMRKEIIFCKLLVEYSLFIKVNTKTQKKLIICVSQYSLTNRDANSKYNYLKDNTWQSFNSQLG